MSCGAHAGTPLSRAFYDRPTEQVARELLGKWLVHTDEGGRRIGRIVETEAYIGVHDKASHSSRGVTPRTRVMFGPPGHAYVYLIYGMHHCFNVVTEAEGHGAAVLIRALEPIEGVQQSASGPGLLCRALGITRSHNEVDLTQSERLRIVDGEDAGTPRITRRPRIGVDYAGAWAKRLLRFYITGNRWISKP